MIFRPLLIWILFLLCCTLLPAQDSGFEQFYDSEESLDEACISASVLPDGRIAVSGFRRPDGLILQGLLLVLYPTGEVDTTIVGSTTLPGGFIESAGYQDGRIVLLGNNTPSPNSRRDNWVLSTFNTDYSLEQTFSLGDLSTDQQPRGALLSANQSLLLTGDTGSSNNGMVTLLDSALNITWRRSLTQPGFAATTMSGALRTDDGFVISGHAKATFTSNGQQILVRYDAVGNLLWSNRYGGSGAEQFIRSEVMRSDDGFLLLNEEIQNDSAVLSSLRIATDGIVLDFQTYYAPGRTILSDAFQLPDESIIAAATNTDADGFQTGVLLKMTATGNVLWSRRFTRENNLAFAAVRPRGGVNEGFVVIGSGTACGRADTDVFVMTVGENGEPTSGCGSTLFPLIAVAENVTSSPYGSSSVYSDGQGITGSFSGRVAMVSDSFCSVLQPTLTLPDTLALCSGESVDLLTGLAPTYSFLWNTGEIEDGITIAEPGRYFFDAVSDCTVVTDTVEVVLQSEGLGPFSDRTFDLCLGDTARLDLSPIGADRYVWDDGASAFNFRLFSEAGTYRLAATNACDTANYSVVVTTRNCCQLYIPNAFSPNGDGVNDVFRPENGAGNCNLLSGWSLRIYDRWGGEVFASDTLGEGWDGRRAGDKKYTTGVYTYVLEYFDGLNAQQEAGNVYLLR